MTVKKVMEFSRRTFFVKFTMASMVLGASPSVLASSGRKSNRLSLLLVKDDRELREIIEKNAMISCASSTIDTDFLYINTANDSKLSARILKEKNIIIEHHCATEAFIEELRSQNKIFAIVERMSGVDNPKLFAKVDFYEGNATEPLNIEKLIGLFLFFQEQTQDLQFRTHYLFT